MRFLILFLFTYSANADSMLEGIVLRGDPYSKIKLGLLVGEKSFESCRAEIKALIKVSLDSSVEPKMRWKKALSNTTSQSCLIELKRSQELSLVPGLPDLLDRRFSDIRYSME